MLSQYNPIDIETALAFASPLPPFPPASERAAWEEVRDAMGQEMVAATIAQAEEDAQSEIPSLPATLYLEFVRSGDRAGYETPVARRRAMLANLTLAECLEHKGRFLDPLLNVIWSICEESSWSYPAHQRQLTDMDHPIVDLFASMTGLQLAEMDLLLGPELDPLVGKRIRWEVDRRLTTPYLTRHDHWWLYNTQSRRVNNWTAVCNGNVVGAAIYLEPDIARLAELIARAARSLDDYLETFDMDGGSTEGPGYWSYGFGNFVILAHLVEHRTSGEVNFFEGEHIRQISQFPLRTQLSPHFYANFSDCDMHVSFPAALLAFLARRLDLPDLMKLANEQLRPDTSQWRRNVTRNILTWGLRTLFWRVDPKMAERFIPAPHDWFGGMAWMLARYDPSDPNALVLAAKGGHNAEMHNQNDVGNIIVHVDGESVIADVGRGRYTRQYFGPERYEHFVNRSIGHSVPAPNGQEQPPGEQYAATVLEHRADATIDLMKLDMKAAYPPEADLASLKRTVALHREPPRGWVELVDEVEFANRPGALASVLTTFGVAEVGAGAVALKGQKGALRVTYDPKVVMPRVELVKDVDLAEGPANVNRVVFAFLQPMKTGVIRLRIEPM